MDASSLPPDPTTIDYEDDDDLYELSTTEVMVWCLLYATIALLAVSGNILVIVVTVTRLRTRSITTYFIINLAIADLLTAIFAIPFKFQAALFQVWHLPHSLCQIVPYTETVTLSVSVFTLTASAIHEFRTVFFPKHSRMNSTIAKLMIVFIWVVALCVSLPHGLFHAVYSLDMGDGVVKQCRPVYADENWWKMYNVYLFIIHYFVPMIILDTAYTMIACKLYSATMKSSVDRPGKNETAPPNVVANKQLIRMLMIVVLVFTVCWAPLESYLALNEVFPIINEWRYINVFFFCSHWLAMSNSCLNPIIYGLFNAKYKREFLRVFRFFLRRSRFDAEDTVMKFDTELESNILCGEREKLHNSINVCLTPREGSSRALLSPMPPADCMLSPSSPTRPLSFYSHVDSSCGKGEAYRVSQSLSCSASLL